MNNLEWFFKNVDIIKIFKRFPLNWKWPLTFEFSCNVKDIMYQTKFTRVSSLDVGNFTWKPTLYECLWPKMTTIKVDQKFQTSKTIQMLLIFSFNCILGIIGQNESNINKNIKSSKVTFRIRANNFDFKTRSENYNVLWRKEVIIFQG